MNHRSDPHSANTPPSERLARTRRDIVSYMKQEKGPERARAAASDRSDDIGYGPSMGEETVDRDPEHDPGSTWHTIKRAAQAWWRSHPGRLALEVAEPMLHKYARAHPVKLLAMAAGVGAVVVLAKPWRLVSITGLAVAALKSSQLSAMAASFMQDKDHGPP